MPLFPSSPPNGYYAGVLTQTVASSACVKWILPARIRSARYKDVVFVGPCSIQLREFLNNGQLADVTTSFELGVPILAAKIISAKAHTVSMEDAILEAGRDEVRFSIDGQLCDDSRPPQILVLSLASSELFFTYAKEFSPGHVGFVYARKHVTGGLALNEKYGKHLAVDPESRALAVAPFKGSFGVLSLKNVSQISSGIDKWDPRNPTSMAPIKEQRFVKVDGTILKMDFLQSTSLEPEKVILLLIVANNGLTRLLLYRWDVRRPLTTLVPMTCSGQILGGGDSFPLLLIPSCKVTSFGIVTASQLVFYHGVTEEEAIRTPYDIPLDDAQPGKTWVQWARPVRHEKHKRNYEDIFLIREDGLLRTFVVNHNLNPPVSNYSYGPGNLGVHIDTAVCMLQPPPTMGGDILLAGGDMEEGGVFQLQPKGHPLKLQSISNWSPIHDLVHLDHKASRKASSTHASTFITSGSRSSLGSILELRYGLEVQINSLMPQLEGSTVDSLWILNREIDSTVLYITSQSENTNIIVHDLHTDELSSIDVSTNHEYIFDESTLACAKMPGDVIVQISKHTVNAVPPAEGKYSRYVVETGSVFLCGAISTQLAVFAAVKRTSERTELLVGQLSTSAEDGISIHTFCQSLDREFVPVGLVITAFHNQPICMVASEDGHILTFGISQSLVLTQLANMDLNHLFELSELLSLSSIAMLTNPGMTHGLLLCGLKTGKLLCFDATLVINAGSTQLEIELEESHELGDTSVSVHTESDGQSRSFNSNAGSVAICGARALYIKLFKNDAGLDYSVDPVILTNRDDQTYSPTMITAYDRIPALSSQDEIGLGGMMAFVTEEHLLLCNRVGMRISPRKARELPSPRLLTYSNHLKQFVVSVASTNSVDAESTRTPTSPIDMPVLQISDLREKQPVQNKIIPQHIICGGPGDRLQVMFNWEPTDGKFHYDMIILGVNSGNEGRLYYLSSTRLRQQSSHSKVKIAARFPKRTITAICAYGLSSLLVCVGRDIRVIHLDMETKAWDEYTRLTLPSVAISISAQGSSIYVATKSHSTIFLREVERRLEMVYSDRWAGTARNIVLNADGALLTNLVSSRGSRILCFHERPQQGVRPAFEVRLPLAVDKINKVGKREQQESRQHFQATATDGTVHLLTTLTADEVKLLKFLEQLIEPYYSTKLKKLSALTGKSLNPYTGKLEASGIATTDAESCHVRGDVLKNMLEPGPLSLRTLMRVKIKTEDEMDIDEKEDDFQRLTQLARPVISGEGDTVELVRIWLRKILRVPSF